jgi:SAM-dependent methyltransferase
MISESYKDLKTIGLVTEASIEKFSNTTRDSQSLPVWRDKKSGVIFIKDFYVGDAIYSSKVDGEQGKSSLKRSSLEDKLDTTRRLADFQKFYYGNVVCEVGFGDGEFMKAAAPHSKEFRGVELNSLSLMDARENGFVVEDNLSKFGENSFDTIILFHTFEHFPDPLNKLHQMMTRLKKGGQLIIEVPHAGDFLLRDAVACESFKQHTLWSQHLILHTRSSLTAMLKHAGFSGITIKGVQRYPLSNHFHWLANGKPGGHLSSLSTIDSLSLLTCYETALARIDATDTIIAVAIKK